MSEAFKEPRCSICSDLKLLSFTAAGKVLGLTRWTVRDMVRAGQLPVIPRGATMRIPLFAVKEHLRRIMVTNGAALKAATDKRTAEGRAGRVS